MTQRPDLGWDVDAEMSNTDKMIAKAKANPMLPLGMVGLSGVVGYMAYKFRGRDRTVPMSVYLIKTRIYAQGTITGALVLFASYQMYLTLSKKKSSDS